jgi:hypothetical protein
VTSTEAMEIEEGMSENERGKMELTSIKRPYAPIIPSPGHSDVENAIPTTLAHMVFEAERKRLRELFQKLTTQRPSYDHIIDSLTRFGFGEYPEYNAQNGTGVSADEMSTWLEQSTNAIELAIQVEEQKSTCTGAEAADALELETSMVQGREVLIDQIARRWKPWSIHRPDVTDAPSLPDLNDNMLSKVDQLVGIIGYNRKRARWLLVESAWDMQTAVAAHYDGDAAKVRTTDQSPDELSGLEMAMAIQASSDQTLLDRTHAPSTSAKSKQSNSGARSYEWGRCTTVAGPSGIKKLPKLTKDEEETELVADRKRVERLIRLNDEEDGEERRGVTSRKIKPFMSAPSSVVDTNDILSTIRAPVGKARTQSTASTKRTHFQTVLDLCGSNATRRRRDSSGDVVTESPPKKRRGTIEDAAITASREMNQVGFIRGGTPFREQPPPTSSIFLPARPVRSTNPPNEELDDAGKIAYIQKLGLANANRSITVLFENKYNLQKAVAQLRAETGTVAPTETQPDTAVPRNPEYTKAIDTKLAELREMGFLDDERNARVLNECYGDVSLATEALLSLTDTSSGDSRAEAEGMELTRLSNVKVPVPTTRGKSKEAQHRDDNNVPLVKGAKYEQVMASNRAHYKGMEFGNWYTNTVSTGSGKENAKASQRQDTLVATDTPEYSNQTPLTSKGTSKYDDISVLAKHNRVLKLRGFQVGAKKGIDRRKGRRVLSAQSPTYEQMLAHLSRATMESMPTWYKNMANDLNKNRKETKQPLSTDSLLFIHAAIASLANGTDKIKAKGKGRASEVTEQTGALYALANFQDIFEDMKKRVEEGNQSSAEIWEAVAEVEKRLEGMRKKHIEEMRQQRKDSAVKLGGG